MTRHGATPTLAGRIADAARRDAREALEEARIRARFSEGSELQGLTPKQAEFVRQYLVDLNGTKAAERAGYSSLSAGKTFKSLLKNPAVRSALQEARDLRARRTRLTQDYVLGHLVELVERSMSGGSLMTKEDAKRLTQGPLSGGFPPGRTEEDAAKGGALRPRRGKKSAALKDSCQCLLPGVVPPESGQRAEAASQSRSGQAAMDSGGQAGFSGGLFPESAASGGETRNWPYDPRTALRALELLGKHLGLFTEKVQFTAKVEHITREQIDATVRAALLIRAQTPEIAAGATERGKDEDGQETASLSLLPL